MNCPLVELLTDWPLFELLTTICGVVGSNKLCTRSIRYCWVKGCGNGRFMHCVQWAWCVICYQVPCSHWCSEKRGKNMSNVPFNHIFWIGETEMAPWPRGWRRWWEWWWNCSSQGKSPGNLNGNIFKIFPISILYLQQLSNASSPAESVVSTSSNPGHSLGSSGASSRSVQP